MPEKRKTEEVKKLVELAGYYFYYDYYSENDTKHRRTVIRDEDGYKYDSLLERIIFKKGIWKVHPKNPFSIENINLYLNKNRKSFYLLDENTYLGKENRNLKFHCKICGEIFINCWNDIRSGQGCGVCSGRQVGNYNNLEYLRPDLAKEWDYEKNEFEPSEYTLGSSESVSWICIFGHRWDAVINSRSGNNRNCPFCAGQKPTEENNFASLFPELLIEWDYDLNGNPEDYLSVTRDNVHWICSNCQFHWQTELQNRTSKGKMSGCPNCKSSRGENNIYYFLNVLSIDSEKEHCFPECRNINLLPFDFYIPNYNLCIEYHGEQHYKPVDFANRGIEWAKSELKKNKKRDKIKENYCKDNNINLLIIPYWEFDNIEEILVDTLNEIKEGSN